VLIVDDVLDSGLTLVRISELVQQLQPRSLKSCVLLEKEIPHHGGYRADYVGFRIPNRFIVGYGLDYRERYRNLPYIGTLKPVVIGFSASAPRAN
jgi:hypoxanthine phosphoribosyltransferase